MNRSLVEEKLICRVPHSIYRIGAIVLGLGSIGLIWCFEFWVPYEFRNYLFNVLQSTGSLFAWLLSIIFLVGVSVTLERIAFILVYSLWSTRIRFNGHNHSEKVMYDEAGDYGVSTTTLETTPFNTYGHALNLVTTVVNIASIFVLRGSCAREI